MSKESELNMATRVSSAIIAIETRAGMCDSGMNMENQEIATNSIEGCKIQKDILIDAEKPISGMTFQICP